MDKEDVYTYTHIHRHRQIYTHIHTMEYYSVIKNNENLPFAATQIDIEGIMLSEISQKEKHKYSLLSPDHL